MKNLDREFKIALTKSVSSICWCWQIVRTDGFVLGFTSLDIPLFIEGTIYQPYSGFDPGAAQHSGDLKSLDSQQLKGILGGNITPQDLAAGLFEFATVRRFLVDYENLPASLSTYPAKFLELPQGYLAESKRTNLGFEIKIKDDLNLLAKQIGNSSSKTCRANLGDDRCRVDLTPFTNDFLVTEVESRRVFKINSNFPDKYFDRGRLQFGSGANQEILRDVGFFFDNKIVLSPDPAPRDIVPGDGVRIIAGCSKTKLDCLVKFRNFHNFVGEPDIPTTDLTVDTPSTGITPDTDLPFGLGYQ